MLIVGEGDAEVLFLKHLKTEFSGICRRAATIRNGHGGGGRSSLEQALRVVSYNRSETYTQIGIFVDTDAHWEDRDRQRASENGITVIESEPCIERVLLAISGTAASGTTAELKRRFEQEFGCEAHMEQYLRSRFERDVLISQRSRVRQLDQLLDLMGIDAA